MSNRFSFISKNWIESINLKFQHRNSLYSRTEKKAPESLKIHFWTLNIVIESKLRILSKKPEKKLFKKPIEFRSMERIQWKLDCKTKFIANNCCWNFCSFFFLSLFLCIWLTIRSDQIAHWICIRCYTATKVYIYVYSSLCLWLNIVSDEKRLIYHSMTP